MNKLTNVNPRGVIRWISSLRGLLVFLVFFSHLTVLPIHKDLLFIIGRIGVAGFFLISGFLAVTSLERRNMKQFLLNRFLRIYPIYWILLVMTFFLTEDHTLKELVCNFTLFEEFVGYDAMIGSSWMLPIMIIFFLMLLLVKKYPNKVDTLFYISCLGSMAIGYLRFFSGKPFPTALCLLICVGLIGFMQKKSGSVFGKRLACKLGLFEVSLVVASALSYEDRVYWYFIAYNLGFLLYFTFQKYNLSFKPFDKLGELGFTFFLGASIPIYCLEYFYPDIMEINCFVFALIQFVLAIVLSYIITRWCEKPLLAWGKRMENHF